MPETELLEFEIINGITIFRNKGYYTTENTPIISTDSSSLEFQSSLENQTSPTTLSIISPRSFTSTFSALPGEAPEEYLEEVDIYGKQAERDNELLRNQLMLMAFRTGLRGEARKWYLKLSTENRKWNQLQTSFVKRFKLRDLDVRQGIATQVYTFQRRKDKTVPSFVKRATELSYQYNDKQTKEMTRRLYACLAGQPGDKLYKEGRRLQIKIGSRLSGEKKLERGNILGKDCTFNDIRGVIINCFVAPGNENNPFMEEDDISSNRPSHEDPFRFIRDIRSIIKDLIGEVQKLKIAPTPSAKSTYSNTPTSSQNQIYQAPHTRNANWGNRYRGQQQQIQGQEYISAQANNRTRRASFGDSQKFICWNCGTRRHGVPQCEYKRQKPEVVDQIRELVEQGKQIPDHLRPIACRGNGQAGGNAVPARMLGVFEIDDLDEEQYREIELSPDA